MFQAIGFLVRLPFFLVGLFFYTLWVIFFIVPFGLIIIPICWFLLALLGSLLSNNLSGFNESMSKLSNEWINAGIEDTIKTYRSIFLWLFGINRRYRY